ncbi:conjugal transfer protein TrbL [Myceligenerans cantabricum]
MSPCDLPIVSGVCLGSEADADTWGPMQWLADLVGGGAELVVQVMWVLLDSTTFVDVTSGHYTRVYNLVFGIAVLVMLVFFLLQVITGMLRREPGALARAALGLAKSVLGSFLVITLTALLLEITDQLCIGIVRAAGTTMEQMGARLTVMVGSVTGASLAPGAGALIQLFLAGLAIGSAFIVWMSLLVRKALLLVTIVLAPLALAGASWDVTRGWVGKWLSFVVALILSKLVLVVVFLVATAQVAAPIDTDLRPIADPAAGIVLMLIAGFAPYMTYKLVSFVGFDMYHAMSVEHEAKDALNRPVPMLPGGWKHGTASGVLDGDGSKDGSPRAGIDRPASPAPASAAARTPGAAQPGLASSPTPSSTAGAAAPVGGAKAAGASGAAGAAGGSGAAAAVAPAAVPLIAVAAGKAAATAGPKAGRAAGAQAGQTSDAAGDTDPGRGASSGAGRRGRSAPASAGGSQPAAAVPGILDEPKRR